jgi:site-specific DNA-cytosine methylase
MGYLYPRLLTGEAKQLYASYEHSSLDELRERSRTGHHSAVYVATGGDRVSETQLEQLRLGVEDLARERGFPGTTTRAENAEFDIALAALLHAETGLAPAEASSRDLWAFLSLVLLPHVAYWRYPKPPGDRVLGTDLTRHVFGRMWWRAQLVHSPGDEDPYGALRILGEGDFDQIYARRAALGGSPHMVKAILRVWNDVDLGGLNRRKALTDFLMRLLRLAPFMLFDGVEERALDTEFRAVAEETIVAMRREVVSASARTAGTTVASQRVVNSEAAGPAVGGRHRLQTRRFTSVEICAGSGAQAFGLEQAGFDPVVLVDSKPYACETIRSNRPTWDVLCGDVLTFDPREYPAVLGVDLLSGGLPRIGSAAKANSDDEVQERDVLAAAVGLVGVIRPRAVLLENLPELVEAEALEPWRSWIRDELEGFGYRTFWRVLNAADFGVPQNRRCGLLVGLSEPYQSVFSWPGPQAGPAPTVGEVLAGSMAANGWGGARSWAVRADRVGPALVGGSDRRGGADLGPTGSKRAWAALGVDGSSLGDAPPAPDFPADGSPKLTNGQAAALQMFPEGWRFAGGKTSVYRQIGHAMPPPLATAVGSAIAAALTARITA